MRTILFTTVLLLSSLCQAYYVFCAGNNTRTNSYVDGWCDTGMFIGYDRQNGHQVTGSCQSGGSLTATDTVTYEMVTGFCGGTPEIHRQSSKSMNLEDLDEQQ